MRLPSRALVIIAVSTCALMMTACQTPNADSSSGETQENDGGFRAPTEPDTGSETATPALKLELRPVYFGYDRSDLTAEARSSLRADATALKALSGVTTIDGHTDERGTFEYNLALGDRRANVVKKYLVALGVSASAIRTKSYGEASPAVKGHDESAWRWNRRAALQH